MELLANKIKPEENDFDFLLTVAFADVMEKDDLLIEYLEKENARLEKMMMTVENEVEDAVIKVETMTKYMKSQDVKIANLKKTIFRQAADIRTTNKMLKKKTEALADGKLSEKAKRKMNKDLAKIAELEKQIHDMEPKEETTKEPEKVEETKKRVVFDPVEKEILQGLQDDHGDDKIRFLLKDNREKMRIYERDFDKLMQGIYEKIHEAGWYNFEGLTPTQKRQLLVHATKESLITDILTSSNIKKEN